MQDEPTSGERPKCPTCGEPMKRAIWGLPAYPTADDEVAMGDALIFGQEFPEFVCADCDTEATE